MTTPGDIPPPVVITDDDHDLGYKDVEVELRSGRTAIWRVSALGYRDAQAALQDMLRTRDTLPIVERCLPTDLFGTGRRHPLDRITPASAGILEYVVFTLCYGESFQKKMATLAQAVMQETLMPPAAPRSSSSAGATGKPSSAPGASPSSASCSASSSTPGSRSSPSTPSPSTTPSNSTGSATSPDPTTSTPTTETPPAAPTTFGA